MKIAPHAALMLAVLLGGSAAAIAAEESPLDRADHMPTAPYLQAGAPTFDMTIAQFREKYNVANPDLPLSEYRAIDNRDDKSNLTRAASKINENLYASTALEHGTGKIRTLQITWLPIPGPAQEAAQAKAVAYMSALLRFFIPTLTADDATKHIIKLLGQGKGSRYFMQTEGALRFVVADNGEKGLTFAIEPLKLALATP